MITLRKAIDTDIYFLFALQYQPGTREFFNNPALPTWTEHQAWFTKSGLWIYVIKRNAVPVGMVNLREPISIIIDESRRGLGIGTKVLRDLIPKAISAEIDPRNGASLAAFARSGFHQQSERLWVRS